MILTPALFAGYPDLTTAQEINSRVMETLVKGSHTLSFRGLLRGREACSTLSTTSLDSTRHISASLLRKLRRSVCGVRRSISTPIYLRRSAAISAVRKLRKGLRPLRTAEIVAELRSGGADLAD